MVAQVAIPQMPPGRRPRRGRPSKLGVILRDSPEVYARMLALIRSGAFSWVAAQGLGIAPETFSRWLSRGARDRRGIYRQFRQDVRQAAAQARVTAEIQVHRENPLAWLRLGPGRTTGGMPGWTDEPIKVRVKIRDHGPPPATSFDGSAAAKALKSLQDRQLLTIQTYGKLLLGPLGD
jgi:hypothetical protein